MSLTKRQLEAMVNYTGTYHAPDKEWANVDDWGSVISC